MLATEHHTAEVDGERAVPHLDPAGGDLDVVAVHVGADRGRVVVHHVEAAVTVERRLHQYRDGCFVGHVRGADARLTTIAQDVGDDGIGALHVDVADDDGSVVGHESARGRGADARRAARHDRHPAGESSHVSSLLSHPCAGR